MRPSTPATGRPSVNDLTVHGLEPPHVTGLPRRREAIRKSLHIAISLVAAALVLTLPAATARLLFLATAGVALLVDFGRLARTPLRRPFLRLFAPLLRDSETRALTGASTLALGFAAAVLLFDASFAAAGILYAGLADAAAAIAGRTIGRHRFASGKSLEGSGAFLVVATLIGWALPGIALPAAFLAAVPLTLLEAVPLPVHDNLVLPPAGAAAAWIAVVAIG